VPLFKEDFSYAIAPSFKSQTTPYIFEEKKQKVRIQTQKVICEISKTDLNITITDLKGNVICEDDTGFLSRSSLKIIMLMHLVLEKIQTLYIGLFHFIMD